MGHFLISFLFFILNYKTLHMYQKYTNKKSSVKLTSDHISAPPSSLSLKINYGFNLKIIPIFLPSLPRCAIWYFTDCVNIVVYINGAPEGRAKQNTINYPYQPQNYCTEISGFHCDSQFYIFTTDKDYI